MSKDDYRHINRAEDGEFVSLLKETTFTLEEGAAQKISNRFSWSHTCVPSDCTESLAASPNTGNRDGERGPTTKGFDLHRAVSVIFDGLDLNLPPSHDHDRE